MYKSYLTFWLRNLCRNKVFSAINILGLALSLTGSLFIFLWVRSELSVDRDHVNGPHLYRIMERQLAEGKREAFPETRYPLPLELPKKFPEIVHAAGFAASHAQMTFAVGDKINKETGDWAGADWFRMFSIPLLAGSPETALNAPNSLAISRSIAKKYFSSPQAAIGKTIRIDNKETYQVTAVFENLPANTVQKYDFLLSWDDFLKRNSWAKYWEAQNPQAYLQLRPDADVAAFEKKIKHFLRGYHRGINPKQLNQLDIELFLQPVEQIYLYSKTENGEIAGGRIEYVRLFSAVAVFLLLIACINFMNLSTARSAKRAKEVGIRKVIGAGRAGLISQFLGEALLMTLLAGGIALALILLLLPTFNQLTGKMITSPFADPGFGLVLAGVVFVTALLSGSYHSLFLSSLKPIQVLKGKLKFQPGASRLREALVVVQFVISMVFIIGTLVVYQQVNFIQNKNLGYNRENLISVPLEGNLLTKYATLKQELQRTPGIQAVTRMGHLPTNFGMVSGMVDWVRKDPTSTTEFTTVSIGYDLVKTLKMKLVNGREYAPDFASDSVGYIINEKAAQQIGYRNPVGQPLTLNEKPGKIIGLVQDFHFQSLHEPIKPLIMSLGENAEYGYLFLRPQPGQTKQALATLQELCQELNPGFPFTYSFVDAAYEQLYRSEQVIGTLANYFAFLAIFIACLGLYGLSTFIMEQRTKEIGIRKVLGASVAQIVSHLSQDFLKLVLLANLLAWPVAYWSMHSWLQNYSFRIPMSTWFFVVPALLVLVIALLTISFQAIKAAVANPVKALRTE